MDGSRRSLCRRVFFTWTRTFTPHCPHAGCISLGRCLKWIQKNICKKITMSISKKTEGLFTRKKNLTARVTKAKELPYLFD